MPRLGDFLPPPPWEGPPVPGGLRWEHLGGVARPRGRTIPSQKTPGARGWRGRVVEVYAGAGEGTGWGSVAYDSAKAIYDLWFEVRKSFSFQEALYVFAVEYAILSEDSLRVAKERVIHELRELIEEDFAPEGELRSYTSKAQGASTFDPLFEVLRDIAWDLWSAIEEVGRLGVDVILEASPPAVPKGRVFPLNVEVEEANYGVGLITALLVEFGLVKSEASFDGFST